MIVHCENGCANTPQWYVTPAFFVDFIIITKFAVNWLVYIYIYIYSTVLKRLATPSDFHIPLPSIVPFAHSYISFSIYPNFLGSSGAAWFFPSFRFPINTLRTGDADLRFYITTVQDG